ncbi:LADA_0B03422g1_1 [Lachancea dasiensis]|uniref:LADA_0B03422g1_1 n=1 Tax=Lachancea dasiensis TaxID=1072105 RepID=A0A1G4ISX1_9SACH|nr:LADA_0B03422g1_1 [Lachancea dasiensis]
MEHPEFSNGLERETQLAILKRSSLKPLFITTVSIDGDNQLSPLSDAVYKSVLEPVLSQPLQTLEQSMTNFSEIKKKLIYTGLFKDVKVSLDREAKGAGLQNLPEDAIKDYNLESPIPTAARIFLTPMQFNNVCLTSTTGDSQSALGGRYSFINTWGKAEVLTLQSELKAVPFSPNRGERNFEAKLMVPLQKNPSVKAVIDASYAKIDLRDLNYVASEDQGLQSQAALNIGVQKTWITKNLSSAPFLYNGLSIVARNIASANGSEKSKSPFSKSSFVSHFSFDNRKFFGLFPAFGVKLAASNEYVISQKLGQSSDTIGSQEHSFNKFAITAEAHRPIFKNRIINSLDIAFGGIIPTVQSTSTTHYMDKFYLGGLASLKGFERNSVGQQGGDFFYKLRLASSFKLPNTPSDSPLRLQCFLNGGDVFDGKLDNFYGAASSGISLLYKSRLANMDLTYAIPFSYRNQDIAKPGFSFGVSLSLY